MENTRTLRETGHHETGLRTQRERSDPVSTTTNTAPEDLSRTALKGAVWTMAATAGIKCVTLIAQVGIAWYLLPKDLGIALLAISIASVVQIVMSVGMCEVLIQDPERIERDIGQAVWLTLALSLVAAAAVCAVSPFAWRIYHEPGIETILQVLALSWPLHAYAAVAPALLYRDLRFGRIAVMHLLGGCVHAGTTLALAALGFGPYALVLPAYAMAVFLTVFTRLSVGPIRFDWPRPGNWRPLCAAGAWILLRSLFQTAQQYAAAFALGILHSSTVVGLYYWGYQVANQAMFLLSEKLSGVLFPSFVKLNGDRDRQYRAFRMTCWMLLLPCVPVCILQALLAEPVIHLLFKPQWAGSVRVVQWLSIGLVFLPLSTLNTSILRAHGDFRFGAILSGATALVISLAALMGAHTGNHASTAAWSGVAFVLTGVASGWIAFRQFGKGIRDLSATTVPLLACGVLGAAAGLLARKILPNPFAIPSIATVTAVVMLTYSVAIALVCPRASRDLLSRVRGVFKGVRALEEPQMVPEPVRGSTAK